MQHEGNGQMDRHPGQIEQCNRPRTDEKAARRFVEVERTWAMSVARYASVYESLIAPARMPARA